MKFLVVGDLHGQHPVVPDVDFDAIIVPGDVCSDEGIKPLMMQAVAARSAGEEVVDWWDVVSREEADALVTSSLSKGREILQELDAYGVPVFVVPGNWDWTGYEDASWDRLNTNLWESEVLVGLENVIDCEDAVVELDGLSIIGYGRVNGPELVELRGYVDVDEEELVESREYFEELVTFFSELFVAAESSVLFLAHNVPYGTWLDVIEDADSPMNNLHYGSNLVRELVEQFQPLLTVGGHIHEHYGVDELGETVCLNAGFGADKATLIEVVNGEVSVELVENK